MASILALLTFLGLFIGGQLLIQRFRGRSHCGGCHGDRNDHDRPLDARSCCGPNPITRPEE